MKINQVKIMAAGMFVLALMTGCGSSEKNPDDNKVKEGSNSIISTDKGITGHNAEGAENQTDTGAGKTDKNGQLQSKTTEDTEGIEEELAAFRTAREKGTSFLGDYTLSVLPNYENYDYGVGDSSYTTRFDSRELDEAYAAAGVYIRNTLNLASAVWTCIDPRMTAIYEDEDKGVANGYDADNIMLCEYNDNGSWQYLILVREEKGSAWEVLYHGSSYKTD